MQPFKIELNDMEALIDTYRQIMEKTAQASQNIKKAQEAGVTMLVAGAAKDTVYNDSGVYRFSKVMDDFAASSRVLHDYTAQALKQFVDMDKLLAKQMYEAIQKDPKTDPKLKQYIEEHPEDASKDMHEMAKDPEGFKQRKEKEQKQREAEAQEQANTQYQAPPVQPQQKKYAYTYDKPKTQPPHQMKTPKGAEPKQAPQPTPNIGQEATSKISDSKISSEAFFHPQSNDVWGSNHKDAHTVMKETIAFQKPTQETWKTEATHMHQGTTGFMPSQPTEAIQPEIKVVTEESKVGDVVNHIFTNLAEVEGK